MANTPHHPVVSQEEEKNPSGIDAILNALKNGGFLFSITMRGIFGWVDSVVNGYHLRALRIFFQDNYGRYAEKMKKYQW